VKHRLTRLQLLEYALEGVLFMRGVHGAPGEYPVEIEEYGAHIKELECRIAAHKAALQEET
jgi:hypothetical protein